MVVVAVGLVAAVAGPVRAAASSAVGEADAAREASSAPEVDPFEFERLKEAAPDDEPRVVPQVHPEIRIAEPYFGVPGEEQVRAASAVTGEPLGLFLDDDTARSRVDTARGEVEIILAVAGLSASGSLVDDLRAAGQAFGVDGDAAVSVETAAVLREATRRSLAAPLLLAGIDPGSLELAGPMRAALARVGHDPGERIDGGDVVVLRRAAERRAGPLVHASGHHPGPTVDVDDLEVMSERVGHDPGATVQPADVAAALSRARTMVLGPAVDVAPGLTLTDVVAYQAGGSVAGHLLSWEVDDERVGVRTRSAGGFSGRASVPALAAAHPDVVAAVNGGFWMGSADPDGLLVTDGELISDPTMTYTWVRGRRSGFVLNADGAVVGAPDWHAVAQSSDGTAEALAIRGVNRRLGARDTVLFTPAYGPTTGTGHGTIEVTLGVAPDLTRSGVVDAPVRAVGAKGDAPIPADSVVLSASGEQGDRLLRLAAAGAIELHIDVPDAWAAAEQGLTGGPLMLQAGVPSPESQWRSEGFAASHTDRRHPRTIVGFDRYGTGYVLVLDGRQPGYSVGATHAEATLLARALGMTEAVMMDGGGSSQLVVDGRLVNRPCCDRSERPVATAITFHRTP